MEQAAAPPSLQQKLASLAARGAGAGPDDVLDLLVDVLALRGWRLTEERRRACAELIWTTTRRASDPGRRQAARRLATLDAVPAELLRALAHEPIEVAEPILRHAVALRGDDLLGVVAEEGAAHLRAVATRPELSEAATTLMLLRGDRPALLACLRNRRARFSRSTLATLAGAAVADPAWRPALCGRRDLPEGAVETLWPHLDAGARARLLAAGFAYGAGDLSEFRAEAARWPVPADAEAAILAMDEPFSLEVAACGLAGAAGCDPGLALNLLRGAYERGAVLLMAGAGLGERAALRVLCSAPSRAVRRPHVASALRALAATTAGEAREVLDALGAHAP